MVFEYFCPLNSDGEEINTADNFNDIYYSLKYEGDLLFTRFVKFSTSFQMVNIAEGLFCDFGNNEPENN